MISRKSTLSLLLHWNYDIRISSSAIGNLVKERVRRRKSGKLWKN